jgi:hypothetical protein
VRNATAIIQSLSERMANLEVGNGGGRRRRRRGRQSRGYTTGSNIPAAEGAPRVLVPSTGGRRRRGRGRMGLGPNIGNGGQICITRTELFESITIPKDAAGTSKPFLSSYLIAPIATTGEPKLPFLANLARVYTRYRWESLTFSWRPGVGTTTDGSVTYGVKLMDADVAKNPSSRIEVSALYPVNDHPIWQGSNLPVAKSLLQSRLWYATYGSIDPVEQGPGTLQVGIAHDALTADKYVGEFWITYTVTFDGTRASGN